MTPSLDKLMLLYGANHISLPEQFQWGHAAYLQIYRDLAFHQKSLLQVTPEDHAPGTSTELARLELNLSVQYESDLIHQIGRIFFSTPEDGPQHST